MALSLGGAFGFSKSKSKTTTDQTTKNTLTPTNPAWLEPQIQAIGDKASGLLGQDPTSFVAGANPLLTQAGSDAAGIQPDNAAYGDAMGLQRGLGNVGASTYAPATVKPNSILPNLDAYMSPYRQQVVDAALADFDKGAGRSVAENKLALAGDTTFGGSAGGLQIAETLGNIARGRGSLSGNLLDQGFQVGANLANLDADRRQQAQLANMNAYNQAGQFNANLIEAALARQAQAGRDLASTASTAQQAAESAAGTKAAIGSTLQGIDQAKAGAPIDVASALASIYGNLPLGLFHGQVEDGTMTGTTKGKNSNMGFSLSAGWK